MSRQWKELALFLVHLIEVKFHQPDFFIDAAKLSFQKTKHRVATVIYSFYIKKQKHSKSFVWMFNW